MKWICINDSRPVDEGRYLCVIQRSFNFAPYVAILSFKKPEGKDPGFYAVDIIQHELKREYDVTYWQSLPEPIEPPEESPEES